MRSYNLYDSVGRSVSAAETSKYLKQRSDIKENANWTE